MGTTTTSIDPTYLHDPSRCDRLRPLREHLDIAAGVSRALWAALREGPVGDPRDVAATITLAGLVADHVSAADAIVRAGVSGGGDEG
jgi:hypothetical protein